MLFLKIYFFKKIEINTILSTKKKFGPEREVI